MSKIIILQFETQEVHVYDYDENIWDNCDIIRYIMSQ